MNSDQLRSLANAMGVAPAVERALYPLERLDVAAEAFLIDHLDELPPTALLFWLTRDEVDGVGRPNARIVHRLRTTLPRHQIFLRLHFADALARVRNEDVRDDLVGALRSALDGDYWLRLALLTTGGEVFRAVRDQERRLFDGSHPCPDEFTRAAAVPFLVPILFEERRDDQACLRLIEQRAGQHESRNYTSWLLEQAHLLGRIEGGLARLVGDLPAIVEVADDERRRTARTLRFAHRWPDRAALGDWVVARALAAAARGVPWESLWWEVPAELRDDVAFASSGTASPAPWLVPATTRRGTSLERWTSGLELLDEEVSDEELDAEAISGALRVASLILERPPTGDEVQDFLDHIDPRNGPAWVFNMKMPEEAADDFDALFIRVAHRHHRFPSYVVNRLLELPATRSRVDAIVSLTLENALAAHGNRVGSFFWNIDAVPPMAEAFGITDDRVPPPPRFTSDTIRTYRAVVGSAIADARFSETLDGLIDAGDVEAAIELVTNAPALLTEERKAKLKRRALGLRLLQLAALQPSVPWLVSEGEVSEQASRSDRDDWSYPTFGSDARVQEEFAEAPGYLAPIMEAKAVSTTMVDLSGVLLDALERRGRPRREVLQLVLQRMARQSVGAVSCDWLASKLDSASLWEEPGEQLLTALLVPVEAESANRVLRVCVESAARRSKLDGEDRNLSSFVRAMHLALHRVLTGLTERSLDSGELGIARRALRAMLHLSPGSHMRSRVRRLRSLKGAVDVEFLIASNEDLLKRPDRHDVPLVDAIADSLAALLTSGDTP